MGRPLQVTPWKLTKRFLLGSARVLVSPLLFAFGSGLRTFTSGPRNVPFCAGTLVEIAAEVHGVLARHCEPDSAMALILV